MKTAKRKKVAARFVSKIQFLRMRLTAAESVWKAAREHVSRSKRRRKLAKLLARRAKKDAKQAKVNLMEARAALAQAQAEAMAFSQRAPRAKLKKTAASKRRPSSQKKTRKAARLIRPLAVAEPTPMPILTEAMIRDASSRQSPSAPAPASGQTTP